MRIMSENAVTALYAKLIAGWNAHDGEAMAEPFAEDGVIIGFDGSVSAGKERIGTEMSNIFADHETARYAVKVRSIRLLGSQAVILRAVAGLVAPGRTAINPRRTLIRQSSPKSNAADGRLCCSRTLRPSFTAARAWSRT